MKSDPVTPTKEVENQIICGDAKDELPKLPSECIDLTVTSPPYDNLREYNGYSFDFERIAQELYRVTKPGGVVVWVVGDATVNGSETGTSFQQALYFKEIGFNLHDTMIYAKTNYIPLTHNRYEQQFEYMFIVSKGKPSTFQPIMKTNWQRGAIKGGSFRQDRDNLGKRHKDVGVAKESFKPNIWFYDVGMNNSTRDKEAFKHPATFPEALVADQIRTWSQEGNLVLDPLNGSGTTTKMAYKLNRKYIGIDISQEYCDIAEQRLKQGVLL